MTLHLTYIFSLIYIITSILLQNLYLFYYLLFKYDFQMNLNVSALIQQNIDRITFILHKTLLEILFVTISGGFRFKYLFCHYDSACKTNWNYKQRSASEAN